MLTNTDVVYNIAIYLLKISSWFTFWSFYDNNFIANISKYTRLSEPQIHLAMTIVKPTGSALNIFATTAALLILL